MADNSRQLINPNEKLYFTIAAVICTLIYIALIVSLVGILYIVLGFLIWLFATGLMMGRIRGNAVKVSESQFPEIHKFALDISKRMNLHSMPDIYIQQEGGALNAFAAKCLRFNYIVLFADVVEIAYKAGVNDLAYIIAHELAHIKRNHLLWRIILAPALAIPLFGSAYSRACEYTCDRHGAHFVPDGAITGLIILSAGKRLYPKVDAMEFARQSFSEHGFWVWLSELFSTHPFLKKRVYANHRFLGGRGFSFSELTQ